MNSPHTRDDIYANGQTAPLPKATLGLKPGQLLRCVSGELGLRSWAESQGHELIVTSDNDGPDSEFDKYLPEAEVVISQPFWPAYLTKERIAKAYNLKLALTAGIGSDHVDLDAAAKAGITVAEVTGSNSISMAEHVVMMELSLVRNYLPAHQISVDGGWNIADCVTRSYDVEGMHFGTIGAGRIGLAVLRRLKAFDMPLHYSQRHRLASAIEEELGLTYHPDAGSLARSVDIVNLQVPLYLSTEHFFNQKMISETKRGSYLINTARAQLVDRDAVVNALKSGHLAGYAGDVWYPQPAPATHPWRTMPWNGMTPHMSGSSLSAQARYAAGTLEILESFLGNLPIREEYLSVDRGQLGETGAKSYQLN
ncbi:NAD-dependent formate dehydrogenase [Raoultella terrigena]|uniref:NAD-dependent formate dehydrogenase n=1 Tax=Klebsiella grimontii TaxID=2058152 RepID=UPI0015EA0688|nr:NAD-dependent formate dehydrogenase [Klebsiella grimontii]MBE8895345.1 NAD-dependent formate dehydrogenase [Klebsiella grimontii]QLT87589.1 NAD-dependent formate dehydrogenase [Klebsiella grimontii]QQQ20264.1 NAD-dependent formate dehydrogenase [Klebsiella grimontii]